jgi:hypothetical protein
LRKNKVNSNIFFINNPDPKINVKAESESGFEENNVGSTTLTAMELLKVKWCTVYAGDEDGLVCFPEG